MLEPKSSHPLYGTWYMMIYRCTSPKCSDYPRYGGRGISVHPSWMDFIRFVRDVGDKPEGTSLDRIDNDKDYEPGNVRWASPKEQALNQKDGDGSRGRGNRRITFNGKTLTLKQWAEELGIHVSSLRTRLDEYNWPLDEALTKHKSAKGDTRDCKRISVDGKLLTIKQIAETCGLPSGVVRNRFRDGWDINRILNTPKAPRKPRAVKL